MLKYRTVFKIYKDIKKVVVSRNGQKLVQKSPLEDTYWCDSFYVYIHIHRDVFACLYLCL